MLTFDFQADVSAPKNHTICTRAAEIVWSEQQTVSDRTSENPQQLTAETQNEESFNLTHKDVKFNKSDILAFAKDKFRNYKRKYDERTHEEKGKKQQATKLRTKRRERQRKV